MVFNIGDRVRFKDDATDQYWSVVNIYPSISKVQILSDCGNISKVVEPLLLVAFDPVSEIKQAIREVLLSEQFLMEFAKAFASASLPSTVQSWSPITGSASEAYCLQKMERERQAEQSKGFLNSDTIPEGYRKLGDSSIEPRQVGDLYWSVSKRRYVAIVLDHLPYANRDNWAACRKVAKEVKPPDGWRWLEVGEILRRFDATFNSNGSLYELNQEKAGRTVTAPNIFIRRNRFEVGEKVVHVDDRHAIPYEIDEYIYSKDAYVVKYKDGHYMYHWSKLAPYIEDAK